MVGETAEVNAPGQADLSCSLQGKHFSFGPPNEKCVLAPPRLPASLLARSHIETESRNGSFCDWGCGLAAHERHARLAWRVEDGGGQLASGGGGQQIAGFYGNFEAGQERGGA